MHTYKSNRHIVTLGNSKMEIKNWKNFIEKCYPEKEGKLTIEFISADSDRYEEEPNIQFRTPNGELKIEIWSDRKFEKLFDIGIYIKTDLELGIERHFEGMEYSEENEKYLCGYIDSFLTEGWMAVDYKFLTIYKTEMKDINGQNYVGPTHYHTIFSLLFYLLSFGGLLTKKIERKFEPLIKTVC